MALRGSKPRIKAALLDVDGTLVDALSAERLCVDLAAQQAATRWPLIVPADLAAAYSSIASTTWPRILDNPSMSPVSWEPDPVIAQIWEESLASVGIKGGQYVDFLVRCFLDNLPRYWRLYPEVHSVLDAISGRYVLAAVTNGPSRHQRLKITSTGLDRYCAVIAVAEEVGRGKPHPEIFQFALERLGVSASETVHIGDSLTLDVGGAAALGIKTVWVNRSSSSATKSAVRPDREIPDLSGLTLALDQISNR